MESKGGRIEGVKGYQYIEMEGWTNDTHNTELSIVVMFIRHYGKWRNLANYFLKWRLY